MIRWWWRRGKFRLLFVEMLEGCLTVCSQTRHWRSPLAGCLLDAALRGTGGEKLVVETPVLRCSKPFGRVIVPRHDGISSVNIAVAFWVGWYVSL